MIRRRGLAIESSPRFLTEWLVLTAHAQQPHLAQNEFSSGAESWGRGQVWRSPAFPCGRSCPDWARSAMEIQTHYLIPGQTGGQIHRYKLPRSPSPRVLRGKQIALLCSRFKWVRAPVELDNSLQSPRRKHLINCIISTSVFLFISCMSSAALTAWLVMVSHPQSLFRMKYGLAWNSPRHPPPPYPHPKAGPSAATHQRVF